MPCYVWVKSVSKSIFKRRRYVLIAYRALIVHKNTVGGEIWCSFLSTHAFLLGNGQTYATPGVPYYRVSRIFMSRIFHPCNMVPHFHVPQVHVSHFQRPQQQSCSFTKQWCIAGSAPGTVTPLARWTRSRLGHDATNTTQQGR